MKQYISSMVVPVRRGMASSFPGDIASGPVFAPSPDDYAHVERVARTVHAGPAIVKRRNGVVGECWRKPEPPAPKVAPAPLPAPAALARRDSEGNVYLQ